jgi:hypothetical protein
MTLIIKRFFTRFGINNILTPRISNNYSINNDENIKLIINDIKLNLNNNKKEYEILTEFDPILGIDFPSSRMINDKEKIDELVNKLKIQKNNKDFDSILGIDFPSSRF